MGVCWGVCPGVVEGATGSLVGVVCPTALLMEFKNLTSPCSCDCVRTQSMSSRRSSRRAETTEQSSSFFLIVMCMEDWLVMSRMADDLS